MGALDPLFAPLTLRHLTIRNRFLSTSHAPGYAGVGDITDTGELHTLAQAGITSINLAATYVNQTRGPQPGGAQRGRALRPRPHRRRLDGAHRPRGDARGHADRSGDAGRGWGLAA
jgi:2,4-dienoyl-CoA reductase-like NADH-dependent reductase (Old Yellow Enzyme family)